MKIVNAVWEKRNFGMDAYEISLEKKDLKNIKEVIDNINAQNFKKAYVVIKLPTGNIELVHKLEDMGYRFLETQLSLVGHFKPLKEDIEFPEKVTKENVEYCEVPKDKNEWEKIISMITPGMFDTDRISLDPMLGKEISCKRYQNWCRDLFEKPNSIMYITKYQGQVCGFSVNDIDERTGKIEGVLGGFFEEYKNSGLGSFWVNDTKENERTAVSSNNPVILKIHQLSGLIVYKERYVLRKIYE